MKSLLLGAVCALTLGLSVSAHATPSLSVRVLEDGVQIGSLSNVVGGLLNFSGSDNDFNYSVGANGVGLDGLLNPNLSSNTLDISSHAWNEHTGYIGTHTLRILVTQTGVTLPSVVNLQSTFNFNALTSSGTTAVFRSFIDPGNVAFALTTPISPLIALTPVLGQAGPFTFTAGPDTLFSETQLYEFTFTQAKQSASASSQLIDAPEPISAALLGTGMIGIGLISRRKGSSATLA